MFEQILPWLVLCLILGAIAAPVAWVAYANEGAPNWHWKILPAVACFFTGPIGLYFAVWLIWGQIKKR